ncbi:MAG: hypothetical protein ABI456_18640 [Ktedonobacteraceae bacterium]
MDQDQSVNRDDLLARVREADDLSRIIKELEPGSPRYTMAILHWAAVGDEVSTSMIRAEETLEAKDLADLAGAVTALEPADDTRWNRYRSGGWYFRAIMGHFLFALRRDDDALETDLVDGGSLVGVGSRRGDDWLATGTFQDTISDLLGLDPQAASMRAERLLKRHTRLEGFPLTLDVVLSHLERQTPQEALHTGGMRPGENAHSPEKIESMLGFIEYSYSTLSLEAQQVLACLAPFTSVLCVDLLEKYIDRLKLQPVLRALPFEHWAQVIQEAKNWGLLTPEAASPSYLHIEPTVLSFLRRRLEMPEQAETRQAIEAGFREYYDEIGEVLYHFLTSTQPQLLLLGRTVAGLEYDNLVTALNLGLAAQVSIAHPYFAVSHYLDATQDYQRGVALAQEVATRLGTYPADTLAGPVGLERISVIDTLAKWHWQLKECEAAQTSYQQALSLLRDHTNLDAKTRRRYSGSFYQKVGAVAQQQRHWSQAEDFYQQALEIFIDGDDRSAQASIYAQLGFLAQSQQQWPYARASLLHALEICVAAHDTYHRSITLSRLALLWQDSGDPTLPLAIASLMTITPAEVEALLRAS